MGLFGRMTHSPLSSAVPVPITSPLLVTVTSLPEAARPAMTSAPAGSTRTTSNDGTAASACEVGVAAGVACVAVGTVDSAAVTDGAVDWVAGAPLFETVGGAASGVTPAESGPAVALVVAGTDGEALSRWVAA